MNERDAYKTICVGLGVLRIAGCINGVVDPEGDWCYTLSSDRWIWNSNR